MRVAGSLFDVMNIGGDGVVFVDVADAVEAHLIVTARADHPIAVNHAVEPFMERDPAFRAADADFMMLDLVSVRIGHGCRPLP